MTRRFDESQLVAAHSVAAVATPCLPGFVACSLSSTPMSVQQFWHAIYQTAFAQAMMMAVIDAQPSKYQRLVYRISAN